MTLAVKGLMMMMMTLLAREGETFHHAGVAPCLLGKGERSVAPCLLRKGKRSVALEWYKDHVTNEEVCAKLQQATGPNEDLLMIVKRRKLQLSLIHI